MYCKGIAFDLQKLVNEKYYRDIPHIDLLNLGFHKTKKMNATIVLKSTK